MTSTILIIDDDKFTRQVLCKILRRDKAISRFKPTVIEAANGREGLRLFEVHRPTLAIVDLLMPQMDGFEVCKKLREIADKDALAIAVTSGVYKDASISERVHEEFQAKFFAKPYQIKNIAEYVAKALSPDRGKGKDDDDRLGRMADGADVPLSGSLKKRSAAKILLDYLEQEKTGRLVLRRAQVIRQIELYVGHPVSITTNVREETLGHFLVSKKRIDSETHRFAMNLAATKKIRFGEAIIEMGVLDANELIRELSAQTRYKLVNALRWRDGTWSFRAGEPRSCNSNAFNVVEVIVGGLAATAQLEPPPHSITALHGKELTLNARGQKLLRQIGASISPSFAANFKANCTIEMLEERDVNQVEIYSCLDILQECDGLVAGPATGHKARNRSDSSDPIDLRELAGAQTRLREDQDLLSALFDSHVPTPTQTGTSPLTALGSVELWKSIAPEAEDEQRQDEAATDTAKVERRDPPRRRRRSSGLKALVLKDDDVVAVNFAKIVESEELTAARSAILGEFLRIQEKTLYDVLGVAANASDEDIVSAHSDLERRFDKEQFTNLDLGRDFQKLNVLHATYNRAMETLRDHQTRKQYDESFQSIGSGITESPSMDAEIAFREAEEFLAGGKGTKAIENLRRAIKIAPNETAYQAELGWAIFVQGNRSAHAADEARVHINSALEKEPDDVLANEYKGLIHAHLEDDIENALLHLERALAGDPRRAEALRTIEQIRIGRGEYAALKQLYRRLLFRLKDSSATEESLIWSRMGDLHLHYLNDEDSALVAYEAASKLTPADELLQAKISEIKDGDRAQYFGRNEELLELWHENPSDSKILLEIFQLANSANHNDGAFLAASGLVAAGHSQEDSDRCYQRNRLRFLVRAQQPLDPELWTKLLHPEDYQLLGALYAVLVPSIQAIAPSAAAQEEVAQADLVEDSALPPAFRAVRSYVAHTLGIPEPAIYSRGDYGRVIHVAAVEPPALLAGYETLTCTDKLELAFRLGRAMSYLRPGRAVVASCPSNVLKSAMLACYSLRSPDASVPDPEGIVEQFKTAIQEADDALRYKVTELVSHISQEHPSLNLSRWVRTLSRTADRVGLLLCGDLPMSLRCVGEMGDQEATTQLLSFGMSADHMQLRQAMGLSIEV